MKKTAKTLLLAALLTTGASAQENAPPSRTDLAYAAGYKAQFICSGLFNGGKSLKDITADELTGIYDFIAGIVPTLDAEIDNESREIRVSFADDAPPRIATWNRRTGCTAMPIGFGGIKGVSAPKTRDLTPKPWPMGDVTPPTPLPAKYSGLSRVAGSAFRTGDSRYGSKAYGGKTSAVVILKGDKIITEAYKPGHNIHSAQRTWSVAKSIAGTLAGYQVQKGLADTNDRLALKQFQSFADPRSAITLDNVMRMASGLVSDTAGNRTDPIYMGGASVSQRTTVWPIMFQPGSRYRYANNDTLLAVQHLMAKDKDFDPKELTDKLGMRHTYIETDWQGTPILSSQVWTTARDLARLGMLYLNNGEWPYGKDGPERLLPEGWRDYISAPSGPQPNGAFGYGATFWLMNNSEGVPKDTFAGFGNRGQYLVIIPSRDLVIVRRGYDTRADRFDIAAFTRDIVAAVPR
jgi:CubicO group peptidase (beta-lactamase class C family)